jgi:hypothetical protein
MSAGRFSPVEKSFEALSVFEVWIAHAHRFDAFLLTIATAAHRVRYRANVKNTKRPAVEGRSGLFVDVPIFIR